MPAEFLNVDLEVEVDGSAAGAADDLSALIEALEPSAYLLSEHQAGRRVVSFELAEEPSGPDEGLRCFASLLGALRGPARRQWDRALARRLDIGIQAAASGPPYRCDLSTDALRGVAALGATVAITVYASGGAHGLNAPAPSA